MRKAALLAIAAVTVGIFLVSAGCGQQGGTEAPENPAVAGAFGGQTPAFYPQQRECPVCGGKPIKKQFSAQFRNQMVYFDKQECVDTFKQDPQKHIQSFMEEKEKEQQEYWEQEQKEAQKYQSGGGGGGQ